MSVISNNSSVKNSKIASIKSSNIDEDFVVGDKVFIVSNPEKTGVVSYKGTTKFSEGLWIGVSLDKPLGKNNGIVQGHVYFECPENHGIFVRKNNLKKVTTTPVSNTPTIESQMNNSNIASQPAEVIKPTDSFVVPSSPANTQSLTQTSFMSSTKALFSLGDRVCVMSRSGHATNKVGTLRFYGPTKFSEGNWVGIELDNPIGKNDGSVDGIRYFSCKPLYGLFALDNKVQKFDPTKHTRQFGMSFSRQGSCESVSSIASNFSSASRTRVRLGINAVGGVGSKIGGNDKLSGLHTSARSKTAVKSVKSKEPDVETAALQKVLKEKEQHIEQLIREREIEQVNFSTITAQVDELTQTVNSLSEERLLYEKKLSDLQNTNSLLGHERDSLLERIEEERRRVEDLTFRIEEKNIDESDLENKTEESESQIFELNEKLALEREQKELLQQKLNELSKKQPSPPKSTAVPDEVYKENEEMKEKINKLELELQRERQVTRQSPGLKNSLEIKTAELNDLTDRFEEMKRKNQENGIIINNLSMELNQLKSLQNDESIANLTLLNDNQLLQSHNKQLSEQLDQITKNYNELKFKIETSEQSRTNKEMQTEGLSGKEEQEYIEEIDELRVERDTIKLKLKELVDKQREREQYVSELTQAVQSKTQEIDTLKKKLESSYYKVKQFDMERAELIKAKESAVKEREEFMSTYGTTHDQLGKLRDQVSELISERQTLLNNNTRLEKTVSNLKSEIVEQKTRIEFMEQENEILSENNSEAEKSKYIDQINKLQMTVRELDDNLKKEKEENLILITKNATLYSELEDIRIVKEEKLTSLVEQMELVDEERTNLLNAHQSLKEEFHEKNEELIIIRERLLKVTQEHETVQDNYNNLNQRYDREKKLQMEKIRKLERQIDEWEKKSQLSQSDSMNDKRRSEGKDVIPNLKVAKENAEQQIAFLNNVIAEREKRYVGIQEENEQLKSRIIDLENGNIVLQSTKVPEIPTKPVLPPRLYCDICEIFDAHDTDDCPLTEEDRKNVASPNLELNKSININNQNGTNRKLAPRLYCDICEIFDAHNTSECEFEETF